MYQRKSVLTLGLALALAMAVGGLAIARADESAKPEKVALSGIAKKKTVKSLGSRRIASQGGEPSALPMGQGEAMLYNMKDTSPRFLSARSEKPGAVRIAGVCRDAYGVAYYSTEKGYSECLDAHGSGNVNEFFEAQRQAGVGIMVGH